MALESTLACCAEKMLLLSFELGLVPIHHWTPSCFLENTYFQPYIPKQRKSPKKRVQSIERWKCAEAYEVAYLALKGAVRPKENRVLLKEAGGHVPRQQLVSELQSLFFEGILAEKLRFWVSRSFIIFEGSVAEKLRFWAPQLHFWRKCRRKASFLSSKASEGSLAEKLHFWTFKLHFLNFKPIESQIDRLANQLNDSQTNWISKQLNLNFEFEIIWISHHLSIWNPNQCLTIISFEIRDSWQPNHLALESVDNQSKPLESQIRWISNHLHLNSITLRWTDNRNIWISNQWNFKAVESQITYISNPLNLKPNEMQNNWIWNQLIFGPSEFHAFFL